MANLLVRQPPEQDRIRLPDKNNRTVFPDGYSSANEKYIPTGRRIVSGKQNRNVSSERGITDHWSVATPEYPTRAASPSVIRDEIFCTTGDVAPSKRGITTRTTSSVRRARRAPKIRSRSPAGYVARHKKSADPAQECDPAAPVIPEMAKA
ncbi:hypothetical protein, partial [Nocardia seriolae]|uniref:hypothetical protein n=1 Tax=Nocardia seriolae TaxID=37332 RepID=UPI001E613341